MQIQQLRNATLILGLGERRILVDPMLGPRHCHPPLRVLGGLQRNPLVDLPEGAWEALNSVTHCLITHCQKGHFDHLDRVGVRWLRERQIPVICTPHDAGYLARRGLNVQPLHHNHHQPGPFFEGRIRTVRCTHGRGLIGALMEHGVGYLIELPGEPSLYLAGDTILTDAVRQFVVEHQPAVSVVPAGGACFDVGAPIIMDIDQVLDFSQLVGGCVVANHLEALGHCPARRATLLRRAQEAGLEQRLLVPADGEVLELVRTGTALRAACH